MGSMAMGKPGKGKTVDEEVKRNARRGVLLMRQAAEAGSRKAMFHMGELLLHGHAPAELKPDHDEAAYMLLKTDADDAPALLRCIDADKVQRRKRESVCASTLTYWLCCRSTKSTTSAESVPGPLPSLASR